MIVKNQNGFSMMEIVMAMGIMTMIGLGINQFLNVQKKELDTQTDDIQSRIAALGAEKVILSDIANSIPSFNYLNVDDDLGRWFFAYDPKFHCHFTGCERSLTLKIENGEVESSRKIYFLVYDPKPGEVGRVQMEVKNLFNDSGVFQYMNYVKSVNPDFDLSKNNLSESPWEPERLILLNSNIHLYDCKNGLKSETATCSFCTSGSNCNRSIKRRFKYLGVVSNDEKKLNMVPITGEANLLKINFNPCRLKKDGTCSLVNIPDGKINSTKDFYEYLPYYPGHDNSTYFQPVKLIRYVLRKNTANLDDRFTRLVREVATFGGGTLKFNTGNNVLVGLKSIEFTRTSVSDPTITLKINRITRYNVDE